MPVKPSGLKDFFFLEFLICEFNFHTCYRSIQIIYCILGEFWLLILSKNWSILSKLSNFCVELFTLLPHFSFEVCRGYSDINNCFIPSSEIFLVLRMISNFLLKPGYLWKCIISLFVLLKYFIVFGFLLLYSCREYQGKSATSLHPGWDTMHIPYWYLLGSFSLLYWKEVKVLASHWATATTT